MQFTFTAQGFKELQAAILRNPAKTKLEVDSFLTRATSLVKRGIINDPWRVHGGGGGAPVNTGNLRDTHETLATPWERIIRPTAPYAMFVHEGTKKMSARPWLDYVMDITRVPIESLQIQLLDNIVNDLAS